MLRLIFRTSRHPHRRRNPPSRRQLSSSSSSSSSTSSHSPPSLSPQCHVTATPPPSALSPLPPPSRAPYLSFLAATAAVSGGAYLIYADEDRSISATLQTAINRSTDSAARILHRMKQTGLAATVLLDSLRSVLSSANLEVRSGFEFRVAAFLADIAAANAARRVAVVAAGDGRVVDWLLETVAGEVSGTQAEAARALAYLIADPVVRKEVFARAHAVPYLLKFIFSSQPRSRKVVRSGDFG